ncbi:MAG TPA: twin-arginine translocase subunit TatC [Candidatus Tectomicrobia bacterium]|nr:twin-arginine translocase subunit TatC [Candidatus Tectomicrobia bacterium]
MIPKIWRRAIGSDDKLPFTDHLDELRHRLIVSLVGVGLGFAVSYGFSQQLLVLLQRPLPSRLIFIAPTEAFFVNLKVAFYAGLFLSVPLLLFQLWKFVAPGLYAHERRYSFPFLIVSTVLFLLGAAFAYAVILPIALRFLIAQGGELWQPNITLSNYLSFCMRLILAAGLVFEFPLLMYFLTKVGVITAESLIKNRKYAILAAFIVSAILTPPDVFSQVLLAVPLFLLFEVSIFVAKRVATGREAVDGQQQG